MKSKPENKKTASPLRFLPSIDALISTETARLIGAEIGAGKLTELARVTVEDLRNELREATNGDYSKESLLEKAETVLHKSFEKLNRRKLQRVINATGVIIHTNLGRAPLSKQAKQAITETAAGYATLEYDVETGRRGRRGRAVEELLCELTGAESAIIVNNCAAAAFLVLSALGNGGEAIVSRGELVEIGGDFRVPDVMAQSGTKLIEVGTTNRTKLSDFETAINENTKLLVRVHPSNFRIVGFTAMPDLSELSALAREKNILLYEDAGSGALVDLSTFGLSDEPVISESIKAGADVVTFSGDKLLGGVQAGLIVGKTEVVERLRKHPLYRALRVDKIAYAALAATLELYHRGKQFEDVPVLRMLSQTKEEIGQRARDFIENFKFQISNLKSENKNLEIGTWNLELIAGVSAVGGGSAPLAQLPTVLIAVENLTLSAADVERRLRLASVPVVARVADERVLLDMRTVCYAEVNEILSALLKIASET